MLSQKADGFIFYVKLYVAFLQQRRLHAEKGSHCHRRRTAAEQCLPQRRTENLVGRNQYLAAFQLQVFRQDVRRRRERDVIVGSKGLLPATETAVFLVLPAAFR